jgi:hypothetical protein
MLCDLPSLKTIISNIIYTLLMSFLSHSHTGVKQNGTGWQGMTLYRIQSHRSTDEIQPMPLIDVSMVTSQRVAGH